MRIIDPHHHLWDTQRYAYPWLSDPVGSPIFGELTSIANPYRLEDFLADAAGQGLEKSVHLQAEYNPRDPVGETRWLQSVADAPESGGFPHGIVAFANLADPHVERTIEAHARFPNLRGVRQMLNRHPEPHLSFVDRELLGDPVWRENFRLLKKYDLSFDLQIYHHQMAAAAEVACENPDILIILCHTGMPLERYATGIARWRAGMRRLAACPNVMVKISGFGMVDHRWTIASIRPFVLDTIEAFGTGRCMFASNFPVDKLMRSYGKIWAAYRKIVASFSEAERQDLFHDNAERIYRI